MPIGRAAASGNAAIVASSSVARDAPSLPTITRECHRTHDARREAAALFIGPGDDLDRHSGLRLRVLQGFECFEGGKRAERSVEAPSGRLAVKVAADQKRWQGGIGALSADKEVRQAVLKNREAALKRQFRQQTPGAAILDAQRLPIDAPGRRRANPGERIEPPEQPLAVNFRPQSHRLRPRMKAFTRCASTWFHQTPSYFSELATITPSTMSRISLALSAVTPLPTSVDNPAASLIILM